MPDVLETDVAVIGAGPGGYAAAFLAADKGMRVTLIDAGPKPGGVCLHVGCIPSKALIHAAQLVTHGEDASAWGIKFAKPQVDLNALRGRKEKIVDTLANNLAELCKRRKVNYLNTRAVFADSHTLDLEAGGQVRFKNCIIATGAVPICPAALALQSPRVMDSTAALKLEDIPDSLLIVGGGYIGLELGIVYAALGSNVTVVEMTASLLPGVDPDLVRPLAKNLATRFANIHLTAKVAKLAEVKSGIRVSLEGEELKEKEITVDRVLVSVGRRPNTANLGLEKTKVERDERGFIKTDKQRRTAEPHIFAIGDVAGEPLLAHKASHEGKLAVEVIAGEPAEWDVQAMPCVVFTDPEIAWCGLTEIEAQREKREVKVARFPWGASGRAMTLGRTDGLTKLIVDPQNDRLLGVGMVGPGVGELISECVVAIEMGATARDLAMCIHPHPTLSESLMEAAESLHGLATHMYKVRKSERQV